MSAAHTCEGLGASPLPCRSPRAQGTLHCLLLRMRFRSTKRPGSTCPAAGPMRCLLARCPGCAASASSEVAASLLIASRAASAACLCCLPPPRLPVPARPVSLLLPLPLVPPLPVRLPVPLTLPEAALPATWSTAGRRSLQPGLSWVPLLGAPPSATPQCARCCSASWLATRPGSTRPPRSAAACESAIACSRSLPWIRSAHSRSSAAKSAAAGVSCSWAEGSSSCREAASAADASTLCSAVALHSWSSAVAVGACRCVKGQAPARWGPWAVQDCRIAGGAVQEDITTGGSPGVLAGGGLHPSAACRPPAAPRRQHGTWPPAAAAMLAGITRLQRWK
jgi:hypothetical protein